MAKKPAVVETPPLPIQERPEAPYSRATNYRWQHAEPSPVQRTAKSEPQRTQPVTVTLVANGRLRPSDHVAGQRWVRDYELGVHGALADPTLGTGAPFVPHGGYDKIPVATIDAVSRNRDAAAAVGPDGYRILKAGIAECLSLAAMASIFTPSSRPVNVRRGADVREVTGLVTATVRRLAEHYEQLDSAHKTKPYAEKAPTGDRVPGRGVRDILEERHERAEDVPWDGRRTGNPSENDNGRSTYPVVTARAAGSRTLTLTGHAA